MGARSNYTLAHCVPLPSGNLWSSWLLNNQITGARLPVMHADSYCELDIESLDDSHSSD